MNRTSLLNLDEPVLGLILAQLDFKSKFNLATTSKELNSVFGRSQCLNNIRFTIDLTDDEVNRTDFNITRNYTNLKLVGFDDDELMNPFVLRKMKLIAESVRQLKIKNSNLSMENLESILSMFKNLNSLKIRNTPISGTVSENSKVTMDKLEKIEMEVDTIITIQKMFMKCRNLNTLIIRPDDDDREMMNKDEDAFSYLRSIIAQQKNLKLFDIADGRFFEGPVAGKFQLEKLMLPIPSMNAKQQKNLKDFVMTQKSIKMLSHNIRVVNESNDLKELFNHIMMNRTIEDLSIVFYSELSALERFLSRSDTEIHNSMKRIALNVTDMDWDEDDDEVATGRVVQAIASKYPNLEHLYMTKNIFEDDDELILLPLAKLKQLKILQIHFFKTMQVSRLRIKSLKEMRLACCDDYAGNLYKFVLEHKQLEELSVSFRGIMNRTQASEIQKFMKLVMKDAKNIKRLTICVCGQFGLLNERYIEKIVKKHGSPGFVLKMCGQTYSAV